MGFSNFLIKKIEYLISINLLKQLLVSYIWLIKMTAYPLEGFQIRYLHGQTIFFEKEDEFNLLDKFKELWQIKNDILKFSFYFTRENQPAIVVQYRNMNDNHDFDYYNWCNLPENEFETYKSYIRDNFVSKI